MAKPSIENVIHPALEVAHVASGWHVALFRRMAKVHPINKLSIATAKKYGLNIVISRPSQAPPIPDEASRKGKMQQDLAASAPSPENTLIPAKNPAFGGEMLAGLFVSIEKPVRDHDKGCPTPARRNSFSVGS